LKNKEEKRLDLGSELGLFLLSELTAILLVNPLHSPSPNPL
jgi:hypothetical protein